MKTKLFQWKMWALFLLMLTTSVATQAQTFVGGRTDFRDETIYFVITTRFYDGDRSNNVQCWDGKDKNAGDPAWRGDFKGLIEKLDYIKALGFTAVWITPVVENASGYDYHGYHAMNFKKVDPRYESNDVSFKTLIDEVHARGMKLILDVVFNHTGNFGENTLAPMYQKDYTKDLSSIDCMVKHPNTVLPSNYDQLTPGAQYQARLALMKNTDGTNHDTKNYFHHYGNFNWDDITSQWAQIAGDCVDLNTENPDVYNYIIEAYSQFIAMGVDGFRIDTGRHISRLVFNKVLNDAFMEAAKKAGNNNFFMFGEICTRDRNVWYRNTAAMSTPFYTWRDSKNYAWSSDAGQFYDKAIFEGNFNQMAAQLTNMQSCIDNYNDNSGTDNQPTSSNHWLNGNDYHNPDHSMHSGLNVIDFPMHWNFENAGSAFGTAKGGDHLYNDATYNVVYVDSHDYAPDGAPEKTRYNQSQEKWAENLALMYSFRGIPCLYYGSEIEFKKGCIIDEGPNLALRNSGRAYFGDYISGSINVSDFANYSNANGNVAVTLQHPLAQHIQRLSKIRMATPALRKGQYSTDGISGGMAFKRRYTDSNTDSYVLVTISGGATFNNILNGTYVDAITGDEKTVTNGSLSVSVSGQGNMRIYVLNTAKTPAPGKIGVEGKFLYSSTPNIPNDIAYPDPTEVLLDEETPVEPPVTPIDPDDLVLADGEYGVFLQKPSGWASTVNAYVYYNDNNNQPVKILGNWPGQTMTSLDGQYYKINFPTNVGNNWKIIFNASGTQLPAEIGFTVVNGKIYTSSSTIDETGPVDPTNPEQPILNPDEEAVFFEKPSDWGDPIYIYVYGNTNGEVVGKWPGSTMISLGNNVYKYTFSQRIGSDWKILFNTNGKQAPGQGQPGFDAINGGYYKSTGYEYTVKLPTGIWENSQPSPASFIIYTINSNIYIQSLLSRTINIVSIDGRIVRKVHITEGENIITGLNKGIYIIDGKKIVL